MSARTRRRSWPSAPPRSGTACRMDAHGAPLTPSCVARRAVDTRFRACEQLTNGPCTRVRGACCTGATGQPSCAGREATPDVFRSMPLGVVWRVSLGDSPVRRQQRVDGLGTGTGRAPVRVGRRDAGGVRHPSRPARSAHSAERRPRRTPTASRVAGARGCRGLRHGRRRMQQYRCRPPLRIASP
jgi:hypothetical protein